MFLIPDAMKSDASSAFSKRLSKMLLGSMLAASSSMANAVTFDFIVPPISESVGTADIVFRITATASETATGTPCFIAGDLLVTTPNSAPFAEDGSDYVFGEPVFFDLLIQPGSGDVFEEYTLSLPIVNDTQVEPLVENLGALFIAGEGAGGQDCFGTSIPSAVNQDVAITDDDALQYAFSPASVTVNEDAGIVSADLSLQNPGDAPFTYSATVPASSQSGTALAGNDFEATVQNLSFTEAQTLQSIDVTLIDDADVESDEVFQIAEAAGVSATDGSGNPILIQIVNSTAVTIVSDDVPDVLSMSLTTATASEADGDVTVEVLRTGALAGVVTVDFTTAAGTALVGEDFQATSGTLTFADGEGGPLSITVPLIDDALNELDEDFQVQLLEPSGSAVIGSATTVVTLTDDDNDRLDFAEAAVTAGEGSGSVTLTVGRTGSALGSISVDYATVAGSAVAATDFLDQSGTLTFGPGELGPLTIVVDLVDDAAPETDESFSVVLSNPVGAAELGVAASTITVTDDDSVGASSSFAFNPVAYTALESAGDLVLQVIRTGDVSQSASVDFEAISGSAQVGEDFDPESGTLTFAPGETGPLDLFVGIIDDGDIEVSEQLQVNLFNPVGGDVNQTAGTATITIDDNDAPGGAPDVTLQGPPGGVVADSFASSIAGASRTTDFGESTVNPATSTGAVTVTYQFTIPTDALPGETFQDRVVTTFGDSETVVERFVTIEVVDGGSTGEGDIVFPSGDLALAENSGTVTITVSRVNGSSGAVSVDYSASSTAAIVGEDYQFTPGTLSWLDGESGDRTFELTLIDDNQSEPDENITLELTNFVATSLPVAPRGGGLSGASGASVPQGLGVPSTIVVTITDDDGVAAGESVEFVSDSITVDEQDGTVDVEVARSGAGVGAVSVDWATVSDSADAGDDFVAASGTLAWPDGDTTNRVITVALTSDADVEGIESFSIELSNPQGTTVGTSASSTVEISDVGESLADTPGLNPEELAVATALDASCDNLAQNADANTPEQDDLLFICSTVRTGLETPDQVRDAIDALSGDELITAATSTLKLLGLQHNTFRNRLSGLRSGKTGTFDVTGLAVEIDGQYLSGAVLNELFGALTGGAAGDADFGRLSFYVNGKLEFGEKDRDSANRGYDFDAQMLTFGADYRLGDNYFIGGALGYEMADVDFAQGGKLDVGGWKGSIYGSYFSGDAFFVDVQASYGRDTYDSKRRIVYDYVGGTIDRTAEGDTKGDQFTAGIASGLDYNKGRLTFGPNVALSYFDVGVKSFTEEGAGGLNLDIGKQIQRSLTFTGGAHLSYVINTKLGVLIPHARIDYVHEFLTSPEFASVRFASDPLTADPTSLTAPLQVQAERIDKDYLLWSLGTSLQMVHGLSGYITYQSTEGYSGLKLQQIAYGLRLERTY